jgi:hypothetical protein
MTRNGSPRRRAEPSSKSGASAIEEDVPPSPGNLSICMYCGVLRIYVEDLSLRELTRAELDEVMRDRELMAAITRARHGIHAADCESLIVNHGIANELMGIVGICASSPA